MVSRDLPALLNRSYSKKVNKVAWEPLALIFATALGTSKLCHKTSEAVNTKGCENKGIAGEVVLSADSTGEELIELLLGS